MRRPQAKDYQVTNEKGENVCFQYSRYIADLGQYSDELEEKTKHLTFMIGETLVENSKKHITDEQCIEKIRKYLKEFE